MTDASRDDELGAEYSPSPVMSTWMLLKATAQDEVLAAHRTVRRQQYQPRGKKGEVTKMMLKKKKKAVYRPCYRFMEIIKTSSRARTLF